MGKSLAQIEEENARESRLRLSIGNDDVDELHTLIEEERGLLDRLSKHPFPNTPLHIAAAAGKTDVAMEIATLKPSFARKLNLKGYTPMHLALEYKHYGTVRTLMAINPNLIRVRGRCGITPLHYVAGKEGDIELELLAEFLHTCQSSIEDLTNQCETAVHVAIKNHNLNAFKVLLGWLRRANLTAILNWKDNNGNTVLHIAVSEKQPEIIKLLIGHVKVNAKNFQDKSALEIFQVNPSGGQDLAKRLHRVGWLHRVGHFGGTSTLNLSQFFSMELTIFEMFISWFAFRDELASNMTITVASLVATATYQAMLTPPGGFWQDNSSNPPVNSTAFATNSSGIAVEKPHKAGEIILSGSTLSSFTFLNAMVFLVSTITIWFTSIPLLSRTSTVYILMCFFGYAYFFTLSIEIPTSRTPIIFLILLSVVLILPTGCAAKYMLLRRRIDVPGGRVATSKE